MMGNNYDSTEDIKTHIERVDELISIMIDKLINRKNNHDASKLVPPEKEAFDKYTPILKDMVYGSDEYKEALMGIGEAIEHHYKNNSHHPEHFDNGINGMTLLDLIEMFCDWKAASEKTKNGDIIHSIQINKDRFNMSQQLVNIFNNTIKELEQ